MTENTGDDPTELRDEFASDGEGWIDSLEGHEGLAHSVWGRLPLEELPSLADDREGGGRPSGRA